MPFCADQLRTSLRISRHLPLYLWLPEMAELKFAAGMSVWWRWPTSFSSVFFCFTSCLSPNRNQPWCNDYSQSVGKNDFVKRFISTGCMLLWCMFRDVRKLFEMSRWVVQRVARTVITFIECCFWCCNNITDSCFGKSGFYWPRVLFPIFRRVCKISKSDY